MEQNIQKLKNELSVPAREDGYEVIYAHASGGRVCRHELVDVKGIDYDDVLEVSIDKATIGCEVHILPTLPEDHPLRSTIFANAKERKCPDLKIDGRYSEVKVPTDKPHIRKINKNIRKAHVQADQVIIKLSSSFDVKILAGIAKGRFISHSTLTVIEIKMDGTYHTFKRSDFL